MGARVTKNESSTRGSLICGYEYKILLPLTLHNSTGHSSHTRYYLMGFNCSGGVSRPNKLYYLRREGLFWI